MRIVVALGGNALLRRGELPDAEPQRRNVVRAAESLAVLAGDHELIITHGNGPQVGVLATESASDPALTRPYPLDSLGAETQGLIGYWLTQALGNVLPHRSVATVLTQCVVDADDPAFVTPTKFVGPALDRAAADHLARAQGWAVAPDGPSWRRVVASPEPRRIVEVEAVRLLVEAGVVVVCAGGGGVPVVRMPDGALAGVEAVIDKDLTSALLADSLGADALLLLTDVAGVETDFGRPGSEVIRWMSIAEARASRLPPGSMGPKVDAAARFVERTGGLAAIGLLTEAQAILAGESGTQLLAAAR